MTTLSIAVASSIQNVVQVQTYAEKIKKRFRINLDKYPDILISLTEAVNNAIIHGNNQDNNKQVKIDCTKTDNGLIISVSDEGNGFDPNCLPDPTCPEKICECGGRGVFLMRELCDNISFANNGSTVKLFFQV